MPHDQPVTDPNAGGKAELTQPPRTPSHAERCRTLAAVARSGALGTIAREPQGFPYASLVALAVDASGRPLLLLSQLAEHTQNLEGCANASILITEPLGGHPSPLALGRVTILGPCRRIDPGEREAARDAFLANHPDATRYIDFKDFAFYRLDPMALRYVGGFGRMSWVGTADYLAAEPDPLRDHAAGILSHMNEDHADALLAYACGIAGIPDATLAAMTAVDRYGFNMAVTTPKGQSDVRLAFDGEATTSDAVRKAMVAMVKAARSALA